MKKYDTLGIEINCENCRYFNENSCARFGKTAPAPSLQCEAVWLPSTNAFKARIKELIDFILTNYNRQTDLTRKLSQRTQNVLRLTKSNNNKI